MVLLIMLACSRRSPKLVSGACKRSTLSRIVAQDRLDLIAPAVLGYHSRELH